MRQSAIRSNTRRFFALVAVLAAFTVMVSPPQTANAQIVWNSPGNSAWLTGTNWTGGAAPTTTQIAEFGVNPTPGTSVGINMNGATNNGANNQAAAAIFVDANRLINLSVGNSSSAAGTLTLNGGTVNGIANTILANLSTTSGVTLTIQNTQGSGTSTMGLKLGSGFSTATPAVIQAAAGRTVAITSIISETTTGSRLSIQGGGTVTLGNGSSTSPTNNTFTGGIAVTGGSTANIATAANLGTAPGSANASYVTLDGGTLNFTTTPAASIGATRGFTIGAGGGTITVATGEAATLLGVLTGTSAATLSVGATGAGTGTLTLNASSPAFSGAVVVTGGATLSIPSGDRLGANPSSPFASELTLNNGTVSFTSTTGLMGANRGIQVGPATGSGSGTISLISGLTLAYNGVIANNPGGTGGLTVTGVGTLSLGGTNTYTGPTTVSTGNLTLNFAAGAAGTPVNDIINAASGLVMTPGTGTSLFTITGATAASNSQSLTAGLTVNGGTSTITLNPGGTGTTTSLNFGSTNVNAGFASVTFNAPTDNGVNGAGAINLGSTLTRSVGGTAQIALPATTLAATFGTASGILADSGGVAFATVGLNDWAAKDAANAAVVAGSSVAGFYTANSSTPGSLSGNANIVNGDTLTGPASPASMRFSNPSTINIGANTLTPGGILVRSDVGGTTAITNGTLQGPAGRDLVVIQNDAVDAMTISAAIVDNGSATGLTKVGPGTLILSGANTFSGPVRISSGTLQVGDGTAANGAIPTGLAIPNNGLLAYNRGAADTTTLSGAISGTGGLSVLSGILITTAANTYTGTTTINSLATLQFGTGGAGGNASSSANVVDNGTLIFNRSSAVTAVPGSITGTGAVIQRGTGSWVMSNNSTYSGATTIEFGTLIAGSTNGLSPNSDHTVNPGAILQINGRSPTIKSLAGGGTLDNSSTTAGTLTVAGDATNTVFSGTVSNTGTGLLSIVKSGTGTLALTGNNTYGGTTAVNGGTLLVNGQTGVNSGTGTGAVTVNGGAAAGGTLGGSGRIAGSVTVNAGTVNGVIAPGNSPGTLTIGGDLTLAGTYTADVIDPAADLIAVTGNLTLGGTLNLPVGNSYAPPASNVTYTLITYGGTLSTTFSSILNLPPSYTVSYGTGSNSAVVLAPTPVPEPAIVLGACAVATGAFGWLRRRRP
jgi:fibronectin-binding autotransporter adhesin